MKISRGQKIIIAIFLIIGIICGIYRLFPYFSSSIPLGYDPGVYRGIFTAYLQLFPGFHLGGHVPYRIVHEPLRGIFSVLMSKIGISIDVFLTRGLGFFSLLGGVLVFIYMRKYSIWIALITMSLFFVSIIQYHAFELCYYKQILGVDILLLLLYLWDRKYYRGSLPVLVGLVLLHRTTTLYLGVSSFLFLLLQYFTHEKISKRFIRIWIVGGIVGLSLYGPLFSRLVLDFVHPLTHTIGGEGIQGDFFSVSQFWRFTALLIIPSLYGIFLKIKHKEYDMILSGTLIGILWVSIGLLNAKRMEVFLDLFMILMSGYGLFHLLFQSRKKVWRWLFFLLFGVQAIYYYGYVSENNLPLISSGEFQSIVTLPSIVPPQGIIVVTDSAISPWIVGYAGRDWIAPGLSDLNIWTHTEWNQRRPMDGQGKCKMFEVYKKLGRPLYLWESKLFREENLSGGTCFHLIREDQYNKVYNIEI